MKSLADVIADLHSTKPTSRAKAIESIKSKSVEWPESVDEYSRVIVAVSECARSGDKRILASAIAALDFLVSEFGTAVASSIPADVRESAPPFPVIARIVSFAVSVLKNPEYVKTEGVIEYLCKLVRSLVSDLLLVNSPSESFTSQVASSLAVALLETKVEKSRQLDLVKAAVWTILSAFPGDFTDTHILPLFGAVLSFYSRAQRVSDMQWITTVVTVVIDNSPLTVRNLFASHENTCARLLGFLESFFVVSDSPQTAQLVNAAAMCMRSVLLLRASLPDPPALEISDNVESVLRAKLDSVSGAEKARLCDLLVDILTARDDGWKLLGDAPESDEVKARIVERMATNERWEDAFLMEKLLTESFFRPKPQFLTVTALLRRVCGAVATVAIADSVIVPPADVSGAFKSAGPESSSFMVRKFAAKAWPVILGEKVTFATVSVAIVLWKIEESGEAIDWMKSATEISSEIATRIGIFLILSRRRFSGIEDFLPGVVGHLEARVAYQLVLGLHGHFAAFPLHHECLNDKKICEICFDSKNFILRESLALRGGLTAGPSLPGPVLSQQVVGKSIKFVERLVKRFTESPVFDRDGLSRSTAVYVVLGSLEATVKCDPCLLTSALAMAAKGPLTRAVAELKTAVIEATDVLGVPIRLCQCAIHVDAMGEPRSLLSQGVATVVSVMSSQFRDENDLIPTNSSRSQTIDRKAAISVTGQCMSLQARDLTTRKRIQTFDQMTTRELIQAAADLLSVDGVDRGGILSHIVASKPRIFANSWNSIQFAQSVFLLGHQVALPDELLGEFLGDLILSKSALCVLVLAGAVVPLLIRGYEESQVVADICSAASDCRRIESAALRAVLAGHVTSGASGILQPVIIAGDYAMSAIDRLRDSSEIVDAAVVMVANSAPPDLIDFIAQERGIVEVLRRARNPGAAVSLGDLETTLHLTSLRGLPVPQELVVRLKSLQRPWFLRHLNLRFPQLGLGPVEPESAIPVKRRRTDSPFTLGADLQIDLGRASFTAKEISDLMIFIVSWVVLCDDFHAQSLPILYSLQSLVSPSLVAPAWLAIRELRPDFPTEPFDPAVALPSKTVNVYPVTETCGMVNDLLGNDLPELLAQGVSRSEPLAIGILPFLLLRGSLLPQALNERISAPTAEAVCHGIVAARLFEFKFTRRFLIVDALLGHLDIVKLAQLLLSRNRAIEAYFLVSLLSSGEGSGTSLAGLFAKPAERLVVTLTALNAMGVRINSLSMSLHPSVRPLVSKLRRDDLGLLFEDDESVVNAALADMGVATRSLSEWTAEFIPSLTVEKLHRIGTQKRLDSSTLAALELVVGQSRWDFLRSIEYKLPSVTDSKFLTATAQILRNASLFPPSLHDDWVSALTALVRRFRKLGRGYQARTLADWTVTTALLPTTSPGVRLGLFYDLAKVLFALDQKSEAVALITALAGSEEASRVDDAAVRSRLPAVLSRAALWLGDLRLDTIDEIRSRYFASAIAVTSDLKQQVKAKTRFVTIIDPIVADAAENKKLLIEEFTLLVEILASGVLQVKKSAWFASRLVSLWFSQSASTTPIVAKHRQALSASKSLLPFFYQIVGRIGRNEKSEFRKELLLFVVEAAKVFPETCLPAILQLRDIGVRANVDAERVKQAEYCIEKLRASPLRNSVDAMVASFNFYLSLAMLKVVPVVEAQGSSSRPGTAVRPRRSVADVQGYREYAAAIAAGVANVLTSPSCTAKSILEEFSVADSGKSLPKIVTVVDTNGQQHKQIVKGNDDLRNDAVLQQLFSLIDAVTTASMRSYKVVPISACAGIAEWVSDTTTLGSYLVGYPDEATGAHSRYNVDDISPSLMKTKMIHARQHSKLLETYVSLTPKFRPSMRYFFYENFASPQAWFAAQSRYSSSVAATSVVGFIVGLGDRHPNNILVDLASGEVVHIDYGICFDAGRSLKIPEIVPFRLTRDVVDGLGPLGTQGPFAKSCEDILVSLKKNSALVTAVVEVFVADPLFNWAVASLGGDNANAALDGVKRKLQGLLDMTDVVPLSPSAQIDRLIRSATDPRNLCQMFVGWQPWL